MFSAIGTASNDGEKRDFGKCQTHVLHYWECVMKKTYTTHIQETSFCSKYCLLISVLSGHSYQKIALLVFVWKACDGFRHWPEI